MTSVNHHSHDRPRCVHCGNERGPWVPTGAHCEHGVQTFLCAPGHGCTVRAAELDSDAIAEQGAQRRAVADIAAAHVANRAELAESAEGLAVGVYARIALAVDRCGLSVTQLADLSGLGLGHLSAVLDGDGELTVTELLLLAGALGVDTAAWFATDEQEATR